MTLTIRPLEQNYPVLPMMPDEMSLRIMLRLPLHLLPVACLVCRKWYFFITQTNELRKVLILSGCQQVAGKLVDPYQRVVASVGVGRVQRPLSFDPLIEGAMAISIRAFQSMALRALAELQAESDPVAARKTADKIKTPTHQAFAFLTIARRDPAFKLDDIRALIGKIGDAADKAAVQKRLGKLTQDFAEAKANARRIRDLIERVEALLKIAQDDPTHELATAQAEIDRVKHEADHEEPGLVNIEDEDEDERMDAQANMQQIRAKIAEAQKLVDEFAIQTPVEEQFLLPHYRGQELVTVTAVDPALDFRVVKVLARQTRDDYDRFHILLRAVYAPDLALQKNN